MINGASRSRTSSKTKKTMKKPRKNKFVTRLSQIMFVSFFGVAGVAGLNFKKTVNLQIDATQKQVSTTASTVEQLLAENNIDKEQYRLTTNDDKIEANETIILSKKKEIVFSIDGQTKNVTTFALTFDEFLKEQNVELLPTHVFVQPETQTGETFLTQYKEIRIDNVTKEKKEVTVKIDLPMQSVETEELLQGQEVIIAGVPKTTLETYEIVKTNGVETSNVKVSEVIVTEGKPAVKKIGKKVLKSDLSSDKEELMRAAGIAESDFQYVNYIVEHESTWRVTATNASSGAYGLPQSLPGNKMASEGDDWRTNPVTQLKWANKYAKERYGSWQKAYEFWLANKVW